MLINRHHTMYPRRVWTSQEHLGQVRTHPKLIIPTLIPNHQQLHADKELKEPPLIDKPTSDLMLDILGNRNQANYWDNRFDGVAKVIGGLLISAETEPRYSRADVMLAMAWSLTKQIVHLDDERIFSGKTTPESIARRTE